MATTNRPSFPIAPRAVRYIKLGEGGQWADECLRDGVARFGAEGARPDRFALAAQGKWNELHASFLSQGKDQGTSTRWTNEVRAFFEDESDTLWLTFVGSRMYWGFLAPNRPQQHSSKVGAFKEIAGGWSCTDKNGEELRIDRLSGALTKLAAYRGTSCNVRLADYAVNRINGMVAPQVERGLAAYEGAKAAALGLVRLLTWKDFETLVDLIFTASGWRRQGVVGKSQKMLDLDVVLPSTGERALVQIKSQSTHAELADYVSQFEADGSFDKLIYVFHTGDVTAIERDDVLVIGPEKVAELALDAGLMRWLIEKAS